MFGLLKPALFAIPAERAHGMTIALLSQLGPRRPPAADPILQCSVGPLTFPSPIGLAAGFDKDARAWEGALGLGFGFVEVGTLTPLPQAGNPAPRVFRLVEDGAVINRLGFNNGGLAAALPRIRAHPLLGVNVGANRQATDRIADYALGVASVRDRAAWITLNISSPNTPGLRGLQGDALPDLLAAARTARGPAGPPLFLKVAPDLDDAQIDAIVAAVLDARLDGLVVSNTTLARPASLRSAHAGQAGGLSGVPLMAPSTAVLRAFAARLSDKVPLIGVGGVASAQDVLEKLLAGASAVQLYTALVYGGPKLVQRINRDLAALLRARGFARVADAVGAGLASGAPGRAGS